MTDSATSIDQDLLNGKGQFQGAGITLYLKLSFSFINCLNAVLTSLYIAGRFVTLYNKYKVCLILGSAEIFMLS